MADLPTPAPQRPAPEAQAHADWSLRSLQPGDLDGLMAVQAACYPADYLEGAAVYARRLASAHQQSLGIECRRTRRLQAYAAAYWSRPGQLTPLHGDFTASAGGEPLLYLHDVAVAPECVGQGAAGQLVRALFQRARAQGVRRAALVSVQGSQAYWRRHGFELQALGDPVQRERLRGYGEDAVYMQASL